MKEIKDMKEEELVKTIKEVYKEIDKRRKLVMEKYNFIYPYKKNERRKK